MDLRGFSIPSVVLTVALTTPLAAQVQVVAPNIYTSAEGPGSSSVPIHILNNPWTFQLIIHENQLTGLVGTEISGIAYRRSGTAGGGYPQQTTTWANYVVRLGASVAPNAATGTFANNFTEGATQVRTGALTVPPNSWPNFGPPGPNPFGPLIAFDTPYFYTGGHLAMQITHPGSDNPNIGDSIVDTTGMASPGLGTNFSYFASTGFDVLSGTASNFMPIVRFTGFAPIPEPSVILLIAAMAGMAAGRAGVARRIRARRSA